VNLSQIVTDFKDHFETAKTDAEKFLTEHLPALAGLAEHAATNPLIDAALQAVHLSPEMLTALAAVITKADADLAALLPAPAAPEPAAEPVAEVPAA
jgi:hypothetical protein